MKRTQRKNSTSALKIFNTQIKFDILCIHLRKQFNEHTESDKQAVDYGIRN